MATRKKAGAEPLVLVADIGGTFARFGLARGTVLIGEPVRMPRADYPDLESACSGFLALHGAGARPDGASIAAAGQVRGDHIEMTNADWLIHEGRLAAALGVERVVLLNDFAALAWVLPLLADADVVRIAAARAPVVDPLGLRLVVGPGTGLGVAALAHAAERGWMTIASEGGHASFAPENAFEDALLDFARQRYRRVSWERLVSGRGLELIHEFLLAQRAPGSARLAAPEIVAAAHAGEPTAARAVAAFVELLAAYAGDLALVFNAAADRHAAGGIEHQRQIAGVCGQQLDERCDRAGRGRLAGVRGRNDLGR
ncbi:MAG TPA: glucokinase, partial [Burkholderiaceae bacterium]|nr:glucokinase [Burkholderiaceae bacterium]